MAKRNVVVNVCWYDEAEWALVKSSADDPERFEDSYNDWLKMMAQSLLKFEKTGMKAVKTPINALEFMGWLVRTGNRNNGESRARFVSEMASGRKPLDYGLN